MPTVTDKQAERELWGAGDYSAIGQKLVFAAEQLVEAADVPAGSRVLDVAAGTGNAALAAARAGCRVTALDLVPRLLEHARARAEAEGVELELVEGDAERLPFEDASFDAVVSVFGVMFAPDQERAAAELARVCRPGGTIAVANWLPGGFAAGFFELLGAYAPEPPPDGPSPMRWGTDAGVRELLGPTAAEIRTAVRTFHLRYASPQAFADVYLRTFGPVVAVASTLDEEARRALRDDLERFASRLSRREDTVSIAGVYLEAIATRAQR